MSPIEAAMDAYCRHPIHVGLFKDQSGHYVRDFRKETPDNGPVIIWRGTDYEQACGFVHQLAWQEAITAFLDAAAKDWDLCRRVGDAAYDKADLSINHSGADAIIALKEAVK